jgi:hypothetical protein
MYEARGLAAWQERLRKALQGQAAEREQLAAVGLRLQTEHLERSTRLDRFRASMRWNEVRAIMQWTVCILPWHAMELSSSVCQKKERMTKTV